MNQNTNHNTDSAPGAAQLKKTAPSRLPVARFAWTLWALVPVGLIAFHYGPGQAAMRKETAARMVARAESIEKDAIALQETAYNAHLAAITARVAAFGSSDEALRAKAAEAGKAEEAAYAKASGVWRQTADALAEAEAAVTDSQGEFRDEIRLARGRALVRSGDVAQGAAILVELLDESTQAIGAGDAGAVRTASATRRESLARAAREELATAYYYGARLMRLAGKPADEWREVASLAKQNFRYLAEDAKSRGAPAEEIANHEKNGELVLNLEQSSLDELYAKPRPRESPTGQCNGLGKQPGKKPGKKPGDKPAKGAGMNGEIGDGW